MYNLLTLMAPDTIVLDGGGAVPDIQGRIRMIRASGRRSWLPGRQTIAATVRQTSRRHPPAREGM
jgi:hypothetical protein